MTARPDTGYPLAGKKIVITGGSRGIGAAVVRLAMAQGAEVVFGYNRSEDQASSWLRKWALSFLTGSASRYAPRSPTLGARRNSRNRRLSALEPRTPSSTMPASRGTRCSPACAPVDWDEVIQTNLGSMFNVTPGR